MKYQLLLNMLNTEFNSCFIFMSLISELVPEISQLNIYLTKMGNIVYAIILLLCVMHSCKGIKLFIRHLLIFVSLDTISCLVQRTEGCWTLLSWPGGYGAVGVWTMWLMPFFLVMAATCQLNYFIAFKQTLVWTEGATGATQWSVRSDWFLIAYSPDHIPG